MRELKAFFKGFKNGIGYFKFGFKNYDEYWWRETGEITGVVTRGVGVVLVAYGSVFGIVYALTSIFT